MTLFPDESILTESSDNSVILTTHRINYEVRSWSKSTTQSIMLEHITSCETLHKKKPFYLFLAFLGLIALILGEGSIISIIGGIVAVMCVVLFFIRQYAFIRVASPTSAILINTSAMQRERILEFIDRIEQAKHKRLIATNPNRG